MSTLSWNCRGLGNPQTVREIMDLASRKKPDFIFLMETKVGREHDESIRVNLGFDGLFYVDLVRLGGGMALLWRKNNTANLLSFPKNHIDIKVSIAGFPECRMTCYCGFPERQRRNESWELIKLLASKFDLPWVMIGDFNDLLFQHEKRGGNLHPDRLLRGFGDAIEKCGLSQMSMGGYQFTWEKGKGTTSWIEERLDKVLSTNSWNSIVLGARVTNLLTRKSDHSVLFLEIRDPSGGRSGRGRGFRFESAWLYDEGCRRVVESWAEGRDRGFQSCVQYCGHRLSRWGGGGGVRFHKFGERIMSLKKAQECLKGCTDPDSLLEYQQFEEHLSRLEAQEDAYWRQRAKQHWLRNADANTRFYYRYASHRKKKNTLTTLMNDAGDWVEGDAMTQVILQYFDNIFCTSHPESGDVIFEGVTPQVTQSHNESLIHPFEREEVKNALFSMFPDKAPSPDGMNPGFYQHFWDVVGRDVSDFVVDCLDAQSFPPGLNETDVVLIPKKETPEFVSDLRPIALSNVIYRIMAKMMANRMKPLMDEVISESQSAFIPDRLITDNILIAAEANANEAGAVTDCLAVYEKLLGQVVNYHKSNICFSKNTCVEDRDEVSQILGVVQAPNFGKYLGLPSFVGRNKKAAFSYIEDKIRQRIGSWIKKLLSQTAIERTMNRYWWGTGSEHGIHWKAWDRLCIPKEFGGLGFKDLRAFNLAMLGKQAWRWLTKGDSLVAHVYKARYYPKDSFSEACLGNNPSFCWRSIMAAKGLVCGGVIRRIGNGESTLIWDYPWLQEDDIFDLIDIPRIVKIPISPDDDDSWYWHWDPSGCYSVKNGYRLIVGNHEDNGGTFNKWLSLWKLKIPPK
ncbi:PREDICTED: uncharacterized protein LOC109164444 [Ipomoea nil]|uniref:uncharacterized protein LOC109164444 n=1 Tax=Ipomoea nil TaxID=35883 RepID=UPI0009013DB5|nr:PREDICTED: uncharacterized protein LOC109164444 [Ipomoea nil]